MKKHGYYCKICGQHKANEKFSGKGHASHICKTCMSLSVLRRNELQALRKIESVDMSFKITREQQSLLRKYAKDYRYPEASSYAKAILERIADKTEVKPMKHEWKKHEKHFYLPKTTPERIDIPTYKYFTIKGQGNPNGADFVARIAALYPAAYAVKMMPKSGFTPDGYFEYTVYPLEGVWDLTEKGRVSVTLDKNELVYKIMLRQPDFVTDEIAKMALDKAKAKKDANPLLGEVKFESITDGACVQILHIGSFDEEPQSFEKMKAYCVENNLIREDLRHREIYISDFRKTVPEKLKTVLRYFVKG